jgi:L-threonylcarbamoyladenylate synthase
MILFYARKVKLTKKYYFAIPLETLILDIDKDGETGINNACRILSEGGVIAIPTETVYGLAVDYRNNDAIDKIYKIKGRPVTKALAAHISTLEQVNLFCDEIPEDFYKLAAAFLPGPLSIVLKKSYRFNSPMIAGLDTIAFRFPANRTAIDLIKAFGRPLAATSANLSGLTSLLDPDEIYKAFNGSIDAVIKGEPCKYGLESTVISLAETKPEILRVGVIKPKEISQVMNYEL